MCGRHHIPDPTADPVAMVHPRPQGDGSIHHPTVPWIACIFTVHIQLHMASVCDIAAVMRTLLNNTATYGLYVSMYVSL